MSGLEPGLPKGHTPPSNVPLLLRLVCDLIRGLHFVIRKQSNAPIKSSWNARYLHPALEPRGNTHASAKILWKNNAGSHVVFLLHYTMLFTV